LLESLNLAFRLGYGCLVVGNPFLGFVKGVDATLKALLDFGNPGLCLGDRKLLKPDELPWVRTSQLC